MPHKIPSNLLILLVVLFILTVCLPSNGVYAFGAGNIPSFAYLEGRAFRHGDIEDILADVAKKTGGGLLGAFAGRSKFGGLDIKRIYFGNWLRDYSQAVDVAALKKVPLQTILNLCMALGFLAHGYATNEFEVTEERLGCYLPTEHIDNPKGYAEGEDARQYYPRLRGPVDPRELEIDPHTGMKNYIANESGHWDTSKALVRRVLEQCIHLGRQYRSNNRKADLYESYRLFGSAMHTLEDFTAHSNFCELVLVSMGHSHVFVHVGDRVRIKAPNGRYVAPLTTGTFGGSDFIHSLLGEATDHISQASVTDLNKELEKANVRSRSGPGGKGGDGAPSSVIKDLLTKIPFGDDPDSGMSRSDMSRGVDDMERIRSGRVDGKSPEEMSPQELHAVLWRVLSFRDAVVKKIEKTIEKIPGLGPLIEKLTENISVFIFTTLEPYLKPIMKTATSGLMSASQEVIDSHDQYEVFDKPGASDPTHSFLSKDHFNLILNEPAGQIAMVVVQYSARLIVKAWNDTSVSVRQVTDEILECLFHPDFHNSNSQIQREMLAKMHEWVKGLGNKQNAVLSRLSKDNVRNHKNIRAKGEGGASSAEGGAAWNAAQNAQHQLGGYLSSIPGVSQAQSLLNPASSVQSGGFGFRSGSGPDAPYSGGSTYGHSGAPGIQSTVSEPVRSGRASEYYSGGTSPGIQSKVSEPVHSGRASEYYSGGTSTRISGSTSEPHSSSYARPSGPPPGQSPAFPSYPGASGTLNTSSHPGYTPSYAPPPGPSYGAPSFPGPAPPGGFSMPGHGPHSGSGGHPQFPDASSYTRPPGGDHYNAPRPGGYGQPRPPW